MTRRPSVATIARHREYLRGSTILDLPEGHGQNSRNYIAVFSDQDEQVTDVYQIENCASPEEAMTRAWIAFCDLLSDCSGADGRIIPLGSAPTDQFSCTILPGLRTA